MKISNNNINGVSIIQIEGELDARSASEWNDFFSNRIEEGDKNFVIDLENLEYSSSAGIRIFLGSARESRQNGGDLRLAAVQPQVNKIFKLSRFDKIVRIFDSTEEAVNSFNVTN